MDRELSFADTFTAIRMGDVRIALAFALECLIMTSPFALLAGAIWLS